MAQEFLGGIYTAETTVVDVVDRVQNESRNHVIVGRDLPGQRFDIRPLALYSPDRFELKRRVFAHQLKQGFSKPFLLPMPQDASLPEIPTGTLTVRFKAAAGADEITMADGITTKLYEGQFIGFHSHTKVYAVVEDWEGTGTVKISPELNADVAAQSNMNLEPNFYAVYQTAPAFGVDPLTKKAAKYVVVSLAEFLG